MFVFKGSLHPYRRVLKGGQRVIETYAEHLPSLSVVSLCEEDGGVDTKILYQLEFINEFHVNCLRWFTKVCEPFQTSENE